MDPVELAKILAKAAVARSASAGPSEFGKPPATTAGRLANVPPPSRLASAPPPKPVPPPKAAAPEYSDPPETVSPSLSPPPPRPPAKPGSRLSAAPKPPARLKSAAEVLEELAKKGEEPEETRVEPPRAEPVRAEGPRSEPPRTAGETRPDVRAAIEVLVKTALPSLNGARVMGSQVVDDRDAQKALWKGHRARFLATGDVEHGLAASAVINALGRTPPGALAVARLSVAERDWLVWVDTSSASCLAAFPNASLWFNGL